jgi:hypothetical protein
MPRDFFDPTPEQQKVVLVDAATLRTYSSIDKICAELGGVNEPVDRNVCGCRHPFTHRQAFAPIASLQSASVGKQSSPSLKMVLHI